MSAAVGERLRRGPPLASIESLLSFEAKSTPRSEFGVMASDVLAPANFRFSDWGGMESILSVDDFQNLAGDKQAEEIFKLLALLSPFANEISALKGSIESALLRIENHSKPMPNISNILRDDIFSPEDKIRLLVLYAYQKGGISKGSRTLIWLGQFLVRAFLAKIPRSEYP